MEAERTGPAGVPSVVDADPAGHRATLTVVRVMGVVAAIAGTWRGVGELAGGSGLRLVRSWPDLAEIEPFRGEAMTLIADLRVAGAVTVLVSLVLGLWVLRVQARGLDGSVLVALSALLLLVGGGLGTALVGLLLGGALLMAVPSDRRAAPPGPTREALGRAWRPLLALTACAFLVLALGGSLLRGISGVGIGWLPAILPILAFIWLVLTLVAAGADDRTARPNRATRRTQAR